MVVCRLSNIYCCCWVCDAQLTYASLSPLVRLPPVLAFAVPRPPPRFVHFSWSVNWYIQSISFIPRNQVSHIRIGLRSCFFAQLQTRTSTFLLSPQSPIHHQRLTMLSFGIFYTLLPRYDLYTHTPSLLFLLFLKAKYGPVMLSHPSTHPSPPDNWRHEALYTFIPLSPTFFSPPPPP